MVNKMEPVSHIIAILAVAIGTCFSVVGVLGYFRLPDVYTRLHAAGMVSIFGVVLLLVTAAFRTPVSWGHALVLILFLLVAGPPTSHAIASAAHRIGLPRKGALRDDLADQADKSGDHPSN
jgi:multicomponent Na+:H+ antiporter subunit G